MKKLIAVAVLVILSAGAVYAKGYEVKKKAGDYEVEVTIDRNPPVVGDNAVSIEIKDKAGQSVKDGKVVVDYSMPAMPGMPPMNYKADAVLKGDVFAATMNLSMAGPWNIVVKITRDGKTSNMRFTIDAK